MWDPYSRAARFYKYVTIAHMGMFFSLGRISSEPIPWGVFGLDGIKEISLE